MEFGEELLAHEDMWFYGGVRRTDESDGVDAGLSGVLTKYLGTMFFGEKSVALDGCLIKFHNDDVIGPIFLSFGACVADESAFAFGWRIKGASGNFGCLFCFNMTRTAADLARHDRHRYLRDLASSSGFHKHTDESLYECVDRLKACTVKKEFKKMEKAFDL